MAMKVDSPLHPSARAATPAAVIISHQEMLTDSSCNTKISAGICTMHSFITIGQPRPRALRELSVMLLQEEMSIIFSLRQCLDRDWQVWSDRREQLPRLSCSMLGQFRANVDRAESPTA